MDLLWNLSWVSRSMTTFGRRPLPPRSSVLLICPTLPLLLPPLGRWLFQFGPTLPLSLFHCNNSSFCHNVKLLGKSPSLRQEGRGMWPSKLLQSGHGWVWIFTSNMSVMFLVLFWILLLLQLCAMKQIHFRFLFWVSYSVKCWWLCSNDKSVGQRAADFIELKQRAPLA